MRPPAPSPKSVSRVVQRPLGATASAVPTDHRHILDRALRKSSHDRGRHLARYRPSLPRGCHGEGHRCFIPRRRAPQRTTCLCQQSAMYWSLGFPPVSAYLRRSGCDEVTNPISDSLANLELNCWLAQSLWADELALRFFGAARARKSSEHHAPRDRSLPFVVASLGYLKLLRHFQTRAEM